MKKIQLFVAAMAMVSMNAFAIDYPAGAPTTPPATPTDMACTGILGYNYFDDANLGFGVQQWAGITWQELEYADYDAKVLFCDSMAWECTTNWGADRYDLSAYAYLHFDLYTTVDSKIKLTIESTKTSEGGVIDFKDGPVVDLVANQWNSFDLPVSNWAFDMKTVRYVTFENFMLADGETSAEGNVLAIGNVYATNTTSDLRTTRATKSAKKCFDGNNFVIEADGVRYNVLGAIVK